MDTVRSSLNLLTQRDQRVLAFIVAAQGVLGLMDLLGIALLGLVVGIAASAATNTSSPILEAITRRLGITITDPILFTAILAGVAALVLILKSLLSFWTTRRAFQFLANRQAMVSGRLSALLLARPLIYVHSRSSQENAFALTSGAASATLGIIGQSVVIASEAALLLVLGFGLVLISPWVTLFTMLYFTAVALIVNRLVSKRAERLGATAAGADIASLSVMQEVLRSYREVFVSGRRGLYVHTFQDRRWIAASVQADLFITSQIPKYVFDIALVVGGGLLVASQTISGNLASGLAVIAIFYVAASRIMPSLMRMQGALIDMRHSSGNAKLTFELAEELEHSSSYSPMSVDVYERELSHITGAMNCSYLGFRPHVIISGVSVLYPGAQVKALDDVSVEISAGQSTALVGPTGAGKSTLADLLLGLLEPETGRVMISDVSPREAIARWPGAISYVPQDIAVKDGTIRENVALGLPGGTILDDRVWEALDRAHLGEFLRSERDGLGTVVGEHGARLSGGQRQRLGLARALYSRPKLLLLDEATSALDSETEYMVNEALTSLRSEVTQVVIAHRLSTVRDCDQVIYIEGGRIAAYGTFSEVRRMSAAFDRQAHLSGL